LRRLTTNVVEIAAPLLLGAIPSEVLSNSAVVWIDRSDRCGRSGRARRRQRPRWRRPRRGCCRWRCGRRCWWRCGERCRWNCRSRLRQSCRHASPAHRHAAIISLCLRPSPYQEIITTAHTSPHTTHTTHARASTTIVWQRCCCAREKP